MKKLLAALALACSILVPVSAAPVVSNMTGGGGPFGSFFGISPGDTIGFSFRADVNLTVSHLGVWGDGGTGQNGVLDSAHQVGLWTIGGALLASTSVDSTGALLDGFYYSAIGPVMLTAGMDYVLGAVYDPNDADSYYSPANFTTTHISTTQGRAPSSSLLGFAFPTVASAGNAGRIGPNMLADPTQVPEPGSLLLAGFALLGLWATRRRVV